MYNIPNNFNIKELLNKEIEEILFSINSISLIFQNGYIQFTGEFSYDTEEENFHRIEVYPVTDDFGLLNLIGKEINNITTNSKRDNLNLEFSDSSILKLLSNEMYESFVIKLSDKEIII